MLGRMRSLILRVVAAMSLLGLVGGEEALEIWEEKGVTRGECGVKKR